jgi:protease I
MSGDLAGRRIAFMIANGGAEEGELTGPWQAVQDAGGIPELLAPEPGKAQAVSYLDRDGTFAVDTVISEAAALCYAGLVLPGGVISSDRLRTIPEAVRFTRDMFAAGRPAAAIGHGPWTLVEAALVRGRTLTSWPSLRTDIINADGTWTGTDVQVCTAGPNVLITSRGPDDLPAFCGTLVRVFGTLSTRGHAPV